MNRLSRYFLVAIILMISIFTWGMAGASAPPAQNPQTDAIGVNGRIPATAPSQAPTITTPVDGSSATSLPIRVAGLCSGNLLIEIFKNDVFSGSAKCTNGSYNLQIDLFSGQNDLVARAFDALNQSSPDSNKVSVTLSDQIAVSGASINLTSVYARRGANPGSELSWPLSISGGSEPYALSVDWGDGSDLQLISQKTAGDFNINHVYQVAGTYNVTIKATDSKGQAAFLQVVAIGNGIVQQPSGSSAGTAAASTSNTGGGLTAAQTKKAVVVSTVTVSGMAVASFWLGRLHQVAAVRGFKIWKRF